MQHKGAFQVHIYVYVCMYVCMCACPRCEFKSTLD